MSIWDELEQQDRNGEAFPAMVEISAWACALVKGQGKVPWDDNAHAGMQRNVAITVIATKNDGFEIKRDMLAFDSAWKMTRASIERLGLKPQDFERGRVAQVRIAPVIGRDGQPETYKNSAGETRMRTTIEILSVDGADGAPSAPAAPSAAAAPASAESAVPEPRDARERIALTWLTQRAANVEGVGDDRYTPQEQAISLYSAAGDLRAKSAVAGISDERWRELCALAVEAMNPPF